jgi:hypothetical protein
MSVLGEGPSGIPSGESDLLLETPVPKDEIIRNNITQKLEILFTDFILTPQPIFQRPRI